jgi:hypothetical protein
MPQSHFKPGKFEIIDHIYNCADDDDYVVDIPETSAVVKA